MDLGRAHHVEALDMHKPCIQCGTPGHESRCDEHRLAQRRTAEQPGENARRRAQGRYTAKQRGYDSAWQRLSARARRLQPFCSDCGHWGSNANPLTCDHSREAWERHDAGLPIRLQDVDVLCRVCNIKRGAARSLTSVGAA